jgi:hypothetical protein
MPDDRRKRRTRGPLPDPLLQQPRFVRVDQKQWERVVVSLATVVETRPAADYSHQGDHLDAELA